jgi:hypothetical protein
VPSRAFGWQLHRHPCLPDAAVQLPHQLCIILKGVVMAIHAARILCMFPLAWCLLLAGCRGRNETAEVAGIVKFGGKPLAEGLVTFRPAAGAVGPEFSGTVAEGKYRVTIRVLPGDYRVEVRAWRKTGRIVKIPYGGGETAETVNAIPKRYLGPDTTLSAHLNAGPNKGDFDLTP